MPNATRPEDVPKPIPPTAVADIALIGGTGIGPRLAKLGGQPLHIPTPYGLLRAKLATYHDTRLLLIQRHSAGHKTPPHLVNYKAIAAGLARAGVKGCLSSAAVGSLVPEWPVGTIAVCTDLVEWSFRRLTLFDHSVIHTDMTRPYPLAPRLAQTCQKLGLPHQAQATYIGVDGPRYETPAEIRMMRTLGAHVVGMTASTEAIALREAGVPYGCLSVVTNLAAGLAPADLHHAEVTDVMQTHGQSVVDVFLAAALEIHQTTSPQTDA